PTNSALISPAPSLPGFFPSAAVVSFSNRHAPSNRFKSSCSGCGVVSFDSCADDMFTAAKPTTQHSAAREIRIPVLLDMWDSETPRITLFHLGNLDEIPAGVVKDGRGDGPMSTGG